MDTKDVLFDEDWPFPHGMSHSVYSSEVMETMKIVAELLGSPKLAGKPTDIVLHALINFLGDYVRAIGGVEGEERVFRQYADRVRDLGE